MINAELLLHTHSITSIATFKLTLPRVLDRHILKHRVFSINSQSSRAMSVSRVIEGIEKNPVRLLAGIAQKGMIASESTEQEREIFETLIAEHEQNAIELAKKLSELNCAKEVVNRYLEPFSHVQLIVTATDWDNFFKLRISKGAQSEIRDLAVAMRDALEKSVPVECTYHFPLIPFEEAFETPIKNLYIISAARCARISYGGRSTTDDIELGKRLLSDGHYTPFEHSATAAEGRHANFTGWQSGRTMFGK